jgi:hypothetical protein
MSFCSLKKTFLYKNYLAFRRATLHNWNNINDGDLYSKSARLVFKPHGLGYILIKCGIK